MRKPTLYYPTSAIDGAGTAVVPHAGSALLLRTAQAVGLPGALREALAPWRRPLAVHDPGKILLDLAVSLAIGGDCLADVAQLRATPEVFGAVASDPTVSRCIDALAADVPAALAAINEPSNWGRLPLPVTGWVYIRLGELLYEWNQPLDAWDHVTRGLERAEPGGDVLEAKPLDRLAEEIEDIEGFGYGEIRSGLLYC